MTKKRRVYKPRVVGGQVMLQAGLERPHKYMLEIEGVDAMRPDPPRLERGCDGGPGRATTHTGSAGP
jgi:hypothetical protein